MVIPNDTLLDVCSCLTRFHVDVLQISSRRFRQFVDTNGPRLPLRVFSHILYHREGQLYFHFCAKGVRFRERPDVNGRSCYEETTVARAFEHLTNAYVNCFCISDMPRPDLVAAFTTRQHTFGVGIFQFSHANLSRLSGAEFAELVRAIPNMHELIFLGGQMRPDHFTNGLVRDCAARNVTYLRNYNHLVDDQYLTEDGVIEFVSIYVRGKDERCKMDVKVFAGFTDEILLKILKGIENGSLVSSFCLTLGNVPEQRLGKYVDDAEEVEAPLRNRHFFIKYLDVEVGLGGSLLYVSRNHRNVNCACSMKTLARLSRSVQGAADGSP